MSIPKKIHYCWFGRGEKPELVKKCMESWKKFCPDYKIIEWNEDNIDISANQYAKEAYEKKKYAFVADYARLYVLYNEGGIYMDTDVEVLKPLDKFLEEKAFSGFENNNKLTTGIIAAEKHNEWIGDLFHIYDDLKFLDAKGEMDLTTNVERVTKVTHEKYGLEEKSCYQNLKDGTVVFYPSEYFSPKDWFTGNINVKENSYTIHHFSASWHSEKEKNNERMYKKKLNRYIEKYKDVEVAKQKLNQMETYKFYLTHPVKAVKRIFEKMRGK